MYLQKWTLILNWTLDIRNVRFVISCTRRENKTRYSLTWRFTSVSQKPLQETVFEKRPCQLNKGVGCVLSLVCLILVRKLVITWRVIGSVLWMMKPHNSKSLIPPPLPQSSARGGLYCEDLRTFWLTTAATKWVLWSFPRSHLCQKRFNGMAFQDVWSSPANFVKIT